MIYKEYTFSNHKISFKGNVREIHFALEYNLQS